MQTQRTMGFMSRGLGKVQCTILQSLKGIVREKGRDQWSPLHVMDISPLIPTLPSSRPERATWRRALRSLEARGLVECEMRTVNVSALPTQQPQFKQALHARLTDRGLDLVHRDWIYTSNQAHDRFARLAYEDDRPPLRWTRHERRRTRTINRYPDDKVQRVKPQLPEPDTD